MSTKSRYLELVGLVNKYNKQYHEDNASEITDYEFDMLNKELKNIEKEHPDWAAADTPTKKVGGRIKREAGVTVTHNVPMLSIQDVFTKEDVIAWIRDVKKMHPDAGFSVEQKIDGLSMSLRYSNGELKLAETRGDGFVGEDVTLNSHEIPDVKLRLDIPYDYLELRGEVYMSHEDFDKTNEQQEILNKKAFANPRNCAAGTLRQLDPAITRERGLRMFIFNIQDGDKELMADHTKGLDYLASKGVAVVPHKLCMTEEEVIQEIDRIGESRGNLDYDIDGAVVKIEQIAYRTDFTAGSKYSAGHIAYKYPPEEKETEIIDIELSVGRTGRIAPTAILKPIRLCGTTVQRVTLHNQDYIDEKGIGIGAKCLIFKSGEIIPKLKEVTSKPEKIYKITDRCPVCNQPVVRETDTADIKCVNPSCPSQLIRTVSYFASRDAMDIKNFGETYVKTLIEQEYIHNYADIYKLKNYRDELVEKGIMGKEKNTDKILKAIEESKSNDAVKLLTGLGIDNVGKASAKVIMKSFSSIDELSRASVDDLIVVQDVGEITAVGIVKFFANQANRDIIEALKSEGVNMSAAKTEGATTKLGGMIFCITGTLPTLGRKEAESMIELNGGRCTGSVSKKTSYLLAGEAAGSKLDKAKELGIAVISEEEFLKMINA